MSIFDLFNKIEKERAGSSPGGKPEFIIAGLGNPGLQYAETRHNTGFMTVDKLAQEKGFDIKKIQFSADCGNTVLGGKSCLVMKPVTYMNNSGEAIEKARSFYKIPCENVIVIYDDISMEPGKLRIRRKGSAGGHNGIKSIIACMGTEDFPRIKIGVGAKPHPDYDLADWVLGKYTEEQKKLVDEAMEKACSALELMVGGNIDQAMNKYSK
jgi:PTH1 family peptidyl-tRNA hydrolase